jgi:outer membrane protein
MRNIFTGALALSFAGMAAAAQAQTADSGYWYVHTGPLVVHYDASAEIKLGGSVVPGASAEIDDDYSVGLETGYRFTPNWSVSLTVGAPPSAQLIGTGPLAGVELGEVNYGPAVLAGQYHFTNFGAKFEPYVGLGVNYTIVLSSKDGAVQNLDVDSPFGFVLQAGVESRINDRWGLFVDAKRIWLDTDARGTVGGAPAEAKVTIDPLIVMAGVSYRF